MPEKDPDDLSEISRLPLTPDTLDNILIENGLQPGEINRLGESQAKKIDSTCPIYIDREESVPYNNKPKNIL